MPKNCVKFSVFGANAPPYTDSSHQISPHRCNVLPLWGKNLKIDSRVTGILALFAVCMLSVKT